MDIFMARQPIFDAQENVFAYELLYRNSELNAFPDISRDQATIEVLVHSFVTVGVDKIAHGRPCFINFTEALLQQRIAENFNPNHVVIEVLEDVPITPELISTLRTLKWQGYSIALDDFVMEEHVELYDELFMLTTYIKVDFMNSTRLQRLMIEQKVQKQFPHIRLLAEKVETREEFEQAKRSGYSLFQGYFFSKPQLIRSADMPSSVVSYFHLSQLLKQDDADIEDVCRIIEKDVPLSFNLLKLVNSPALRTKSTIKSIRQAIMMLGFIELSKWLYVLALREIKRSDDSGRSNEIMASALFRAKACELLAKSTQAGNASEFFLAGMFSLVDVLMNKEMSDILAQVPLSDTVKETLLDADTIITPFLRLVRAMDEVNWHAIEEKAAELHIGSGLLQQIYEEARQWSNEVTDYAAEETHTSL